MNDLKFLYWNTKKISSFTIILDLLDHCKPDFLFLSEIDDSLITDNIVEYNKIGYVHYPNPGCSRILILKKEKIKCNLGVQTVYYTTLNIPTYDIFVISVHLPSQMFNSYDGLKNYLRNMRLNIDSKVGNSNDTKILIIGDFNVNPFEKPMIDFDGFSATNTKNFRNKVTNLSDEKVLYYNPTWKLYRYNEFPGSKYFPRPSGSSFDVLEHHFLDQVILSKELLKNLKDEKIELIYKTTKNNYFDVTKNKILISDHLPLQYQLKLT